MSNDEPSRKDGGDQNRKADGDVSWGRYVGVGLEIAVGVTLGYFVGNWFDKRYNWHGNGVLVGVMIGLAAGMYLLIKDAIRINKD